MSKYADYKTNTIEWDNLNELLLEAKKTYQRGMKVATKEFDFELEERCEKIKKNYKEIRSAIALKNSINEQLRQKFDIEDVISNIILVETYINIINFCLRFEYGIKEED